MESNDEVLDSVQVQGKTMSYDNWKEANNAKSLLGKNVLVVGATQGIGSGVAIRFAQLGSNVIIAGRNEAAANQILKKMKETAKSESEQEFTFLRVDATSVKDLHRFTEVIISYFTCLIFFL
jgi:NAD(P)-dependent dehydrogenase (short-subunit alcohol dehydrogenase family)